MEVRVLIIVLCYNGLPLTLACLQSLQTLRGTGHDVLVIDNASTDGTPMAVKAAFPVVTVLETGANIGFAAGNNVGLRYALARDYDFALLLNNDTEVAPDLIGELRSVCDANHDIGIAGPKILYHDWPQRIYSAGGAIDWRRGRSAMVGLDAADDGRWDIGRSVDFVTGCALFVRCKALEQAGLLDERFGMYYEETEWCVRMASHGWQIRYVPTARVWHKISPMQQAESPWITYYMARNRLLFLLLTKAPLTAWLHACLLQDLRTWCALRIRPRWRHRAVHRAALVRAWRDFVLRRFGMVAWESR